MFERGIIQLLAAWKTDVNRKPLVIHGARQVGKTWALKYFGQKYFEDVAYLVWIKMKADFAISLKRLKTPNALYSNCPFCMDEKLILRLLC